jgi:histidine triad (HIT) family protein
MDRQENCIFCRIIERRAPAYVIHETDDVIAFLSLENHPLVVPKEHVPDIFAMSEETGAAVMAETIRIARAVKEALQCDGVYLTQSNGAAAGQDVFHSHLHVYPCWEGREGKSIGRFVRSVTDPDSVTDELQEGTMRKIQEALARA